MLKSTHLHCPRSLAAVVLLVAALVSSCTASTFPGTNSTAGPGTLTISIGNQISERTLAPLLSMVAVSYEISGSGPGQATFTASTTGAPVAKANLTSGSWSLVVNAFNTDGTRIGTGTATVVLVAGQGSTVLVPVTPVMGTGTLALSANWPSQAVGTPSILASLTPSQGSAQTLNFTVSGATASFNSAAVPTGYHTLSVSLLDRGTVAAGSVQVVRIVEGQTTSGTLSFTDVGTAGSLLATVSTNLQNPLAVGISGSTGTLPRGQTSVLTANLDSPPAAVAYAWYVNGVSVGSGNSYTFGSGQLPGSYRVDLVAISGDGTQAGSATANLVVSSQPTMTVGGFVFGATMTAGAWQSGTWTPYNLPSGATGAVETGLVKSSGNVYAAGSVRSAGSPPVSSPAVWLNGSVSTLPLPAGGVSGSVSALAVSGTKVYAVGSVNTASGSLPGYWLNGTWTALSLPSGATAGSASAVGVSGTAVYVAGTTSSGLPGYWLNGAWTALALPSGTTSAAVKALGFSGTDVMIVGEAGSLPGYWRNGTWASLTLPPGTSSGSATGVVVSGSDFYIHGNASGPSGGQPGYWRNGTWQGLALPEGTTLAVAQSLGVSGTDVCVAGFTDTGVGFWWNGYWTPLPVPSGASGGNLTSVVLE